MADELGNLDDCFVTKETTGKRAVATTDPGITKNPDGSTNFYKEIEVSPPIEHYMYRPLADVTVVNGPYTIGTAQIDLQAGHGFVNPSGFAEDFIVIRATDPGNLVLPDRFYQSRVVAVVGNTISLGIPLDFVLDTANIVSAERVTVDLNVLGGTLLSPLEYKTFAPGTQRWLFTRMMFNFICASQPDDSEFGDIARLTNGITFRYMSPLVTQYLINIVDNGEFASSAYDVRYSARSVPTGSWGVNIRKSFSGEDKWGIALPFNFAGGEMFSILVRDDLSGLSRFRIKVMGHVYLPEFRGFQLP